MCRFHVILSRTNNMNAVAHGASDFGVGHEENEVVASAIIDWSNFSLDC